MIRYIKASPRLASSIAAGIVMYFLLPADWRTVTRAIVAWDGATSLYLVLALWMMGHASIDKIRRRAALQDDGRMAMLILTTIAALTSLAAIVAELAAAKALTGHAQWPHITLAGLTVFLSWTFLQMIYALHYAHEFYSDPQSDTKPGLEFPGHQPPDYWDFLYYSFIIGTAAQTADVNIISPHIRKITTLHCVVAFFFNTTILALMVNIGAGLF